MVLAEFERLDGGSIRLVMKGHSSLKANGQFIVCASISSVFYTLIGYLKNTFDSRCKIRKIKPGDVDIVCDGQGSEAFRMACIGFIQISEQFPTEISVINRVWDSKLCRMPSLDNIRLNYEETADE